MTKKVASSAGNRKISDFFTKKKPPNALEQDARTILVAAAAVAAPPNTAGSAGAGGRAGGEEALAAKRQHTGDASASGATQQLVQQQQQKPAPAAPALPAIRDLQRTTLAHRKLVTSREDELTYGPLLGTGGNWSIQHALSLHGTPSGAAAPSPGNSQAASGNASGKALARGSASGSMGASGGGAGAGGALGRGSAVKFTPLEQQVMELKRKHPGVLLVIEVGYKFRCFGEDADVASHACNIYAYPDHNFLTCGFPVFRLPVYVRRLVQAGHKVGVVRQVETAAIKSQSSNKSAPFERHLTALYTAATLEAAQRADKAGEEGSLEQFAELDGASLGAGTQPKYMLFVAEAASSSATPVQRAVPPPNVLELLDSNEEGSAAGLDTLVYQEDERQVEGPVGQGWRCQGPGRNCAADTLGAAAAAATVAAESEAVGRRLQDQAGGLVVAGVEAELALLAVEPSTGDVQLGLASAFASSTGAGGSARGADPTRGSGASGQRSRVGASAANSSPIPSPLSLDAALLSLAPVELVVLEPVGPATLRTLQAYASCTPCCRVERQRAWGHGAAVVGGGGEVERQLSRLYTGGGGAAEGGAPGAGPSPEGLSGNADGQQVQGHGRGADRLQAALQLPQHAQRALAAATYHLEGFGLQDVLSCQPDWDKQEGCVAALPAANLPGAAGPPPQPASSQRRPGDTGTQDESGAMERLLRLLGLRPMLQQRAGRCMRLSGNALRQLEILTSSEDGPHQPERFKGSLLHLMDRTYTPPGGRLLRAWVAAPLADAALVSARLDAVEELAGVRGTKSTQAGPLSRLADVLRKLPDLERGLTRMLHRTPPPAELVATLCALRDVPTALGLQYERDDEMPPSQQHAQHTQHAVQRLKELPPGVVVSPLLATLLASAASPEAHAACQDLLSCLDLKAARQNRTVDCLVDPERFADVARAKQDVSNALDALQGLLPGIAKQLGVRSLEYTSIQHQGDWLIELPVEQEKRVPKDWLRVCGTKKVGRYHPPVVSSAMLELAVCRERLEATAQSAYIRFLGTFLQHYPACRAAAAALAQLDTLLSLASVARTPGYCRPTVLPCGLHGGAARLLIKGGKHPMLDAQLASCGRPAITGGGKGAAAAEGAVPNDVELDGQGCRAAIITGPNMGGKSCLIRQAALTAIMAQVGSFVPAESCTLTVLDGVYTRMGASDNLLLGRSTFMEELGDTSDILQHATSHSLVIMDELGRGTATHDGVSIAAATLEYLVRRTRCLALFVTHYPEVAQLTHSLAPHVRSFHMMYVRNDDDAAADAPEEQAEAPVAATGPPRKNQLSLDGSGDQATPAAMDVDAGADGAAAGGAGVGGDDGDTSGATRGVAGEVAPSITFLYKLREGTADASFGLNVAQMAGLPAGVLRSAARQAARMQRLEAGQGVVRAAQAVAAGLRRVAATQVAGQPTGSSGHGLAPEALGAAKELLRWAQGLASVALQDMAGHGRDQRVDERWRKMQRRQGLSELLT